ncbi:MAG: hypothetical protein A3J76_01100 [Candidatus Moranbacteria bacterium RBG_13_45_13]|nr:MAG: hypothetical protein A3J76_01100 [Candidatus Moranbacteria bacterium RBG_13_45_13]
MRKIQFANDQYYHVFNRGVDKRKVFTDSKEYERFILSLILMNDEKDGMMIKWRNYKDSHPSSSLDKFLKLSFSERRRLVEIIAYCCNPNHFHFILKQVSEKGIEKFMHRLSTGYTKYFNDKHHRSGSLFQGTFKATHINRDGLLLYLVVYVNCNSEIHGVAKAKNYRWCSFPCYLKKGRNDIVNKSIILEEFNNLHSFKEFSVSHIRHFEERKADEKIFIES